MQFGPRRTLDAPYVVPGRHRLTAEVACEPEQVGELHTLVAAHAWHRRLALGVAVGERGDDRVAEALLGVDDVVRDAEMVGHAAGVVDVAPGAAGAAPGRSAARVVELQGCADDLVALLGHHRAVDAAGHRGEHAHVRPAAG